jgi:hypothetical protein
MRKLLTLGLVVGLFVSLGGAAGAFEVTPYTDKDAWENAVGENFAIENFNDLQLNEGVSLVSSESGGINLNFGYYHDVLASYSNNNPQTIWTFTPQIYAYGGTWTLGGPGGGGNSLLIYITDISYPEDSDFEYVKSISNGYNQEFWGFTSTTPFTSVKLVGGSGSNQQNYKLDDMVYSMIAAGDSAPTGYTSDIFSRTYTMNSNVVQNPVPPSVLLLGSGLVGLGFWRRFRKS